MGMKQQHREQSIYRQQSFLLSKQSHCGQQAWQPDEQLLQVPSPQVDVEAFTAGGSTTTEVSTGIATGIADSSSLLSSSLKWKEAGLVMFEVGTANRFTVNGSLHHCIMFALGKTNNRPAFANYCRNGND